MLDEPHKPSMASAATKAEICGRLYKGSKIKNAFLDKTCVRLRCANRTYVLVVLFLLLIVALASFFLGATLLALALTGAVTGGAALAAGAGGAAFLLGSGLLLAGLSKELGLGVVQIGVELVAAMIFILFIPHSAGAAEFVAGVGLILLLIAWVNNVFNTTRKYNGL